MDGMERLDRLGGAQHGLVTRAQVVDAGWSASGLRRLVGGGRLVVVRPSVYRLAGAPVTWEQRLLAAVLGGRAGRRCVAPVRRSPLAASGRRRIGGDGARRAPPSSPRCRRPPVRRRRRGRVRATQRHPDDDAPAPARRSRSGRARARPGGRARPRPRASADHGGRRRTHARRPGPSRPWWRGCAPVRARPPRPRGEERPDSVLEPRMARLLRDAGLPAAVFQHEVCNGGRFVARVDFAYPDVRLALEVDGWGSHSSPRALQSDLARQNALVALGWTVLRFTWIDVVRRPGEVAAQVAGVLWTLRTA